MSLQPFSICIACQAIYQNQRSLSLHLSNFEYCIQTFTNFQNQNLQSTQAKQSAISPPTQNIQQDLENDTDDNTSIQSSIPWGILLNQDEDVIISDYSFTESRTLHYLDNIVHKVILLQIINELGTPLYAYKRILDWAREAQLFNYNFESQHGTYQQTIKFLEHKLHLGITRPETTTVNMYKDIMHIDVIVYDVKKMLMSLFDDVSLNQKENMVVNTNNVFYKYIPTNNQLGEVNSGKWYKVAYDNHISDPETEFLCPIILASDKTTISEMGDLHVNAIFMTTSMYDYKVHKTLLGFLLCKPHTKTGLDKKQSFSMACHCLHPKRKKFYSTVEYNSKFKKQEKTYCLQQLYAAALSSLKHYQQKDVLQNTRLQLGKESNFCQFENSINVFYRR